MSDAADNRKARGRAKAVLDVADDRHANADELRPSGQALESIPRRNFGLLPR